MDVDQVKQLRLMKIGVILDDLVPRATLEDVAGVYHHNGEYHLVPFTELDDESTQIINEWNVKRLYLLNYAEYLLLWLGLDLRHFLDHLDECTQDQLSVLATGLLLGLSYCLSRSKLRDAISYNYSSKWTTRDAVLTGQEYITEKMIRDEEIKLCEVPWCNKYRCQIDRAARETMTAYEESLINDVN